MTTPPQAWTDANEDLHTSAESALGSPLRSVQEQMDSWMNVRTKLFDGSTWFGAASSAARTLVTQHIDHMRETQHAIEALSAFHNFA